MYDRILVPTDGSEEARKAVDHAIDLAAMASATVHALFVIESRFATLPSDSMQQVTEQREWRQYGEGITEEVVADAERRGVSGVATVGQGKAHREIVKYADENDIDLIVMGTHGRDGVQDVILGNVTERVVRTSNVPVLTIRRGKLE